MFDQDDSGAAELRGERLPKYRVRTPQARAGSHPKKRAFPWRGESRLQFCGQYAILAQIGDTGLESMIFALLPVKSPQNAKQRLTGFLSPEQREILARTMFEEVLATLCSVRGLDRIAVATSDPAIALRARSSGVEVFEEHEQLGHSHSADAASQRAASLGARSVILMPIDVPLVTRGEIEDLIAEACDGVIVVPSGDGTGTNALVRTPPNAIPACFGPNSFRAHCGQAESLGLRLKVMRPAGLLFDIDTPEDVAEMLERAPESRVGRLLRAQLSAA
jgi:2-phospho-L-lactate guanylyltransferase